MRKGFTLVELVVYLGLIVLLLVTITSTVVMASQSYRRTKALGTVNRAATVLLERLTREIRIADALSDLSIWETDPGTLVLASGEPVELLEFYLEDGVVILKRGGVVVGPLTPETASVESLVFRKLELGTAQGVRVETIIDGQPFYVSVELRGSSDS